MHSGMGWDYPPGSMRGSGIYTYEVERYDVCGAPVPWTDEEPSQGWDKCRFEGDVTITIDDFGHGGWECPSCGAFHEVDEADLFSDPEQDHWDRDRDEEMEDRFYDD